MIACYRKLALCNTVDCPAMESSSLFHIVLIFLHMRTFELYIDFLIETNLSLIND